MRPRAEWEILVTLLSFSAPKALRVALVLLSLSVCWVSATWAATGATVTRHDPLTKWTYGYDGTNAPTLAALIAALEARWAAQFDRCISNSVGVYSCSKNTVTGNSPELTGTPDYINGEPARLYLHLQRFTQYRDQNGTVTTGTGNGGDILVSNGKICEPGFSVKQEVVGTESIKRWCERIEPLTCPSPKAGNPIDAASGDKLDTATDYVSPNGLLHVTRHYRNQREGWRFGREPRLIDLTGRTPTPMCASLPATYTLPDGAAPTGTAATVLWQCANYLSTTGANNEVFVDLVSGLRLRFLETSPGLFAGDNINSARYKLAAIDSAANEGASWALTAGDDSITYYAVDGKVLRVVEPGRSRVDYGYSNGRLVSRTDQNGRSLTYQYDTQGRIEFVVLPDGNRIHYEYGVLATDPFLRRVIYPDGTSREYLYNETAYISASTANLVALTGIIDENGVRIGTYRYDSSRRAISTEGASGVNKFTFNYQTGYTEITDPIGTIRRHNFVTLADGAKAPSSETQPAGSGCPAATATMQRDGNGFLSSKKDFNGNTTTYVFNARGLEESRTEAQGTTKARTITTQWHPVFRQPELVTEPGRETSSGYDSATGALQNRTVKDLATDETRTTTYGYQPGTAILESVDGPRTEVTDLTTYAYRTQDDSNMPMRYRKGDLWTVTNALGHVTEITEYDSHGNPLRVVDPNGIEIVLTYDLRQRLKTRTVGGETTSFDYYLTGLLQKATAPDGSWLQYTYDDAHRLTDITDQDGNRIHYVLDNAGNRKSEEVYDPTNTLRRSQTRVYDALSRLQELRGGNGQVSVYGYDANGNNTTETVDGSFVTTRNYDALNRLFKVTDAASGLTQYGYNALDQPTSVTDPRGLVTSYTVNAFGDVTQLQSPDTGTTTSTYDSAGNLKTRTDAKGQTSTYSYDALNRLTQVVHGAGPTITYTYDQGPNGKGRLTGMTDGSGSSSWTYDALGRVATRTQVAGGRTLTVSYSYDTTGRLTRITLPTGKRVDYSWNGNRISGITWNSNPLVSGLAWEPFGPASAWSFANGEQVQKTWDLSGRMTGHSLGSIGHDTADRITSLTHGGVSHLAGSKTYGYDSLHRLTSYSGFGVDIGYAYDANGNRTEQNGTSGTLTSTIDPNSNRLTALTSGGGAQNFQYDANGSQTSDGVKTYGYDGAGRLTAASPNASYTYNGLGQRVSKTVGTSTTLFVYDEAGHLVGEYNAAGTGAIREHAWLGDTPIAVLRGTSAYYVHADHLNTPRQIDNQAGDPVWLWDTITFGASAADQDPLSTGTNFDYRLRHPGQYYDWETGLFQNWFRDYNPNVGRYAESDPIGLEGGLNTYAYALLDPLSYIDPTGLAWDPGQRGGFGPGVGPSGPSLGGGGVAQSESIAVRARAIHAVNDPLAQRFRTTAVAEASECRIVASGGRDLSPAQRAALSPGEVAARAPGLHAEQTLIRQAQEMGVTLRAIEATRRICPACVQAIEAAGGRLTGPTTAVFP